MRLNKQPMESWESYPTFCYSAQGKNPILTAPKFIFSFDTAICSEIQFQQLRRHLKIVTPKPSTVCGLVNDR
jgi:hypothetical protein